MNKQQYLAELHRLLSFMSEEDRDLTIRHYSSLFDDVGEAGEAILAVQLESPTKAAIILARGYEAGNVQKVLPHPDVSALQEATASVEAPAPLTPEEIVSAVMPDFALPDIALPIQPSAGETAVRTETEVPVPTAAEAGAEEETEVVPVGPFPSNGVGSAPPEDGPADRTAEEFLGDTQTEKPAARSDSREGGMPRGARVFLFILIIIVLGVPLAAVCLAVILALLVPGGGICVGAVLSVVGGMWCLGYMADAIMMFGVAFVLLALGLVVLWAGIWVDIKVGKLYGAGLRWLSRKFLKRQVTEDA